MNNKKKAPDVFFRQLLIFGRSNNSEHQTVPAQRLGDLKGAKPENVSSMINPSIFIIFIYNFLF